MDGLLARPLFPIAYVTNDIDDGVDVLSQTYGIGEFLRFENSGQGDSGPRLNIALGMDWRDDDRADPICWNAGSTLRYGFRPGEHAIRFHHLGHLYATVTQWHETRAALVAGQVAVMREAVITGMLRFLYADTRPMTVTFTNISCWRPVGRICSIMCPATPPRGLYD